MMIHWWKILSFENEFGKGRDIRSGPPVDFFYPFYTCHFLDRFWTFLSKCRFKCNLASR